jgi:RNA polymerase sigma-70 factor (ECF subfamily)
MSRSDEQKVIARARRGNADAFREIVEAYQDRLFAFVWRMLRNHHEAEDVCQTAFVKAYESLASYSKQYAFSTWLFTIAYRLCLNTIRKKKAVSGNTDFSYVSSRVESAEVTLANSEEARRLKKVIWEAVEKLTPAQKSAVLLFYRESKSCEEIGQVLDMPAVTVKSHLHRARAKLRRNLSGELVHDWMAIEFLADSRTA